MKWTRIRIKTITDAEDIIISELYDYGLEGAQIEDKIPLSPLEKEQMFVDILPESEPDDGVAYLSFFIEEGTADIEETLTNVRTALEDIRTYMDIGEGSITVDETEDLDWINNWKKYFHQFYIDDLLVIPSWEEVEVKDKDKMILHIDPGTAFGTGMHETTQLCIRQMKKYLTSDTELLDIGTGSGILAILALMYGAKHCVGTDLDPCAVMAVKENMEANNIHILGSDTKLIDALRQINILAPEPLVLFVVDEDNRMVGTLTDGDSRRALIAGVSVNDPIEKVIHRNFNFLRKGVDDDVQHLHDQKVKKMKLVPILDDDNHIVEIVNLDKYITSLPVDAVLMAGGKGERLRPLTEKTPKPLLEVGGKCIIDHNVDRLISYGVKHINVTVNYLGEQIEEHFETPRDGVHVRTFREPKFLGTIGSIKFVDTFYNDTVLVMNSDLFTNIDYEDFFLHFQQHDAEMSVAAVPYNVSIQLGILNLDGRNIKGLIEKPKYNYYANAGIYLIKKRALAEIPEDTFFHATHLIEKLIAQGKKVIRYPLNGTWIDIGTHQEYERAKELVKHLR